MAGRLFFREATGISKMPLASRTKAPVRFALTFAVDKREEWRQMFDEFYRYWKYKLCRGRNARVDWAAIRRRYEPLVEKIGQTDDFYMLGNEMLNELNSSHSGITAPPKARLRTGGWWRTRWTRRRWWWRRDSAGTHAVPGTRTQTGRAWPQNRLHL